MSQNERVDARPLLLFDSGVGGLSVLAHIRTALPQAPIVYVADNAGYPYGTKTEAEITARVPTLLGRLVERYQPRLVVIPCNTASTIALPHMRLALNLPVVGTVPAIKPAALVSKTRVIGVLGTQATVRQIYVDQLIADYASDCTVIRYGSPELVDIAEEKLRGTPVNPDHMRVIMDQLFDQPDGNRIDVITLSCTHFPLLAAEIAAACPRSVTLVDSGAGIARRTAALLQDATWPAASIGRAVFTAADQSIALLAPALAGYGLTRIESL